MDLTLQKEAPLFKRCCFCFPLRRGLIGWGYARLALNIIIILYLFVIVSIILHYRHLRYAVSYIALLSFFIIDVAFTLLLVVAGHKKSSKLLRISYLYSIAWLIMVLGFGVFGVMIDINRMYLAQRIYRIRIFELVMDCALLFTVIFVQVYLILLTRSEAIKLQNQSLEVQFVNNAAEAEARCVSVEQRCVNDGHNVVQCADDRHDSVPQDTIRYEPNDLA